MKTTILAASLGIALFFGPGPAAARAPLGSPGPLNAPFDVTVVVKSYSQSEKPGALLFDETMEPATLKGQLQIGDPINDFETNIQASGTVSSAALQISVKLDLTGVRMGKNVYLSGTAVPMETSNGISPFPDGSIVLTGRISTSKATEKATKLALVGLAKAGSSANALKLMGKPAKID